VSKRNPFKKACMVCGKKFPAVRSDARFCGPTCRQWASRSRRGKVYTCYGDTSSFKGRLNALFNSK
jgi:predicted nucleic acid-binding Zn ribbon protein